MHIRIQLMIEVGCSQYKSTKPPLETTRFFRAGFCSHNFWSKWQVVWALTRQGIPGPWKLWYITGPPVLFLEQYIFTNTYIWVNYNISLTWNKPIWGWFPSLTMIPVRSQWGRYNLTRYMYLYLITLVAKSIQKYHQERYDEMIWHVMKHWVGGSNACKCD